MDPYIVSRGRAVTSMHACRPGRHGFGFVSRQNCNIDLGSQTDPPFIEYKGKVQEREIKSSDALCTTSPIDANWCIEYELMLVTYPF